MNKRHGIIFFLAHRSFKRYLTAKPAAAFPEFENPMGSSYKRSEEEEIEPSVVTVDVQAAKRLLHSTHRYLDVRTEEEFKKGHLDLENSFNVPYMFFTPEGRVKNPNFVDQVSSVSAKDEPLVVGCQSGVRSLYATTDLLNAGFKNAQNMGGGYIAWLENNFSVKKSSKSEL